MSDTPTTTLMASQRFAVAQRVLLDPNGIDLDTLSRTLDTLRGNGTDYADLYCEASASETWRIEDGLVTSSDYALSQGAGIRTQSGDRATLAYTGDLGERSLKTAADAARGMQETGGVHRVRDDMVRLGHLRDGLDGGHDLYAADDIVSAGSAVARIALLRDIDRRARAEDSRISRVTAAVHLTQTIVLIAATDGTLVADTRPMLKLNIQVIAESNGRRARGSAGVGGRYGLDALSDEAVQHMIARATGMALVNLDARSAPAGTMSVVLASGFPGILLHEAIGHGLEGDAHRKRSSVFAQRMGEMIAAPGVTVVDDGTLPGFAGSLNIDDEGTPTERTTLIENGRLVGLMQDRTNARLMNQRSTGNGRRESYAALPLPRMTNTFLTAGTEDPADIIRSVDRGIYAVEFGGGTVDVTSGRFNFSATLAYMIEDGKVTAPINGATLIGIGDEALQRISMIGHDLRLDEGEAVCGKEGQSVFVGVGQPTIRIDDMVVGGV